MIKMQVHMLNELQCVVIFKIIFFLHIRYRGTGGHGNFFIKQLSKSFGGALSDKDVIALLGISRNSYYKYKKEILEGLVEGNE